ncbi:cell division ATP-binding protein FtsE [Actinotignum urinale]|uniref:Cell division ATP-binding protein FtsE n=2 Tax=Actinotignum TaxID=1653174 RepID=A0ABU5G566_9ACTO|nr:cell division ATP-binding protein FtsE [Actinotignum urinale]MDY5132510.1 cell division ATP-binding protein FtsE [Actinotignum urinale]MDY5159956.1 cell division ATP-binding protein FtsE [Actinotignum urinale]WIK58704.1 cell division ATP-binding protein FtsE [Actinotignum urinale]
MITFDKVTKLYEKGAKPALDGVTVDIDRGEFVFLVGPSGSGKSTMIGLIMAEIRPTAGRVDVLGRDLSTVSARRVPLLRRRIGTVFQDFRLLKDKNVYDNVALALQVIGAPRHRIKTEVPEVLQLVGLDGKENRRINELSGGEQQRVTIARAMVNRPEILLADEPTGNLDQNTGLSIMRILDRINRAGTTVVMATHDATVVNQMRKRVIELSNGVIVRDQARGQYGGGQK